MKTLAKDSILSKLKVMLRQKIFNAVIDINDAWGFRIYVCVGS
jgi:hypothetical protein